MTDTIDWSAQACVARGVEFLDETLPETWDERIILYELEMKSTCTCVCGFSFAKEADRTEMGSGYDYALMEYGQGFKTVTIEGYDHSPATRRVGRGYAWARYHGFDAGRSDLDGEKYASYDELQAEWKKIIMERRCDRAVRDKKLVIGERELAHA